MPRHAVIAATCYSGLLEEAQLRLFELGHITNDPCRQA